MKRLLSIVGWNKIGVTAPSPTPQGERPSEGGMRGEKRSKFRDGNARGFTRLRATLRRGFTLIEFIIYIAISSIVIVAVMRGTLSLLQIRSKISLLLPVQQEVRFAARRITRTIRTALAINTSASVFASSNGVLSLTMSDSLQNPTVFSLSDGAITATEGSSPPTALTSRSVVVQQLRFENLSAPQTPGTVKLTIQARDIASEKTLSLETSVSLRY